MTYMQKDIRSHLKIILWATKASLRWLLVFGNKKRSVTLEGRDSVVTGRSATNRRAGLCSREGESSLVSQALPSRA